MEHRPEYLDVGKALIAAELIVCERETALFRRDGKSWYEYLFNELSTNFCDFEKNQLSILTFNYDRSLEHYLLTSLQNSYDKSIEECAEKLSKIPIIHLHGDLGALPALERHQSRPYCKRRLKSAAGGARKVPHLPSKGNWIFRSPSSC